MLTYVLILAVVVAVLYGSYRALAGGEAVAADDYRAVLARLCGFTWGRANELSAALAVPPPAPGGGERIVDPLVEVAGSARKHLGGYHQQLTTVETAARGAEREDLETARGLLAAAIEDLAWACRMIEGGTYRDNPGIQAAVAQLREHGDACLRAAAPLVGADVEPAVAR